MLQYIPRFWLFPTLMSFGVAALGCSAEPSSGIGGVDGTPAPAGSGGSSAGEHSSASGTGGLGGSGGAEMPGGTGGGSGHAGTAGQAGNGIAVGSDEIYGQAVPRAQSWWTEQGRIYHGTEQIRLHGLNWFGLETDVLALFGPVESGRSVPDFLAQITALGFNALRIPLAPESIRPGHATAPWAVRGNLSTGRANFDELAQAAMDAGIYMLWDIHTCAASVGYLAGAPDAPECNGYGVQDWLEDLTSLAALAEDYAPYVVGIDLFNEPHDLDWNRWRSLAEQGGEAVLRENPQLLVFVEGIGAAGYTGSHPPFWGENLMRALDEPIGLPASRLVYSPHVYGPSVYSQTYFADPSFPNNMPAIWNEHFGFLFDANATVVPGEFGGRYTGADRTWQDAFVDYLLPHDVAGFFYWSLNPNSGDTGGLLQDDWRTVEQGKLTLLQRLMRSRRRE